MINIYKPSELKEKEAVGKIIYYLNNETINYYSEKEFINHYKEALNCIGINAIGIKINDNKKDTEFYKEILKTQYNEFGLDYIDDNSNIVKISYNHFDI